MALSVPTVGFWSDNNISVEHGLHHGRGMEASRLILPLGYVGTSQERPRFICGREGKEPGPRFLLTAYECTMVRHTLKREAVDVHLQGYLVVTAQKVTI
jgi:hypothetical protein